MKVLAINCGSSTLKFRLFTMEAETTSSPEGQQIAAGIVDRIGSRAAIDFAATGGQQLRSEAEVADHGEASRVVFDWLSTLLPGGLSALEAVGHRVVHGGDRFVEPTLIVGEVVEAIRGLSELAPLHNIPALSAIEASRAALGSRTPIVATFDSAFHRTLPERASHYAIPLDLAARHHIYRYGFHGLAHRYMTDRYATLTAMPIEKVKLVTVQLGNGCSATAIDGGRSIDTSMGFTPLEGLMMGTRSGDVDPSLVSYLARREGLGADDIEHQLNTRSGLLGVSGRSRDMRELLEADIRDDRRAALAVEMFCYRARKYIGAYLAALGGAHAVVFGGGIGENAPAVRARICANMGWCGLNLQPDRNERTIGLEGRISTDGSTVEACVILVVEEIVIARDTIWCMRR
jgi:acetate kinase